MTTLGIDENGIYRKVAITDYQKIDFHVNKTRRIGFKCVADTQTTISTEVYTGR